MTCGDELLYFADPMCSWCWGFSPTVRALADRFGAGLPINVVVGGLCCGPSCALTEQKAKEIEQHWRDVNAATGQPFDHAFWERGAFVYDTEPSCRAVVAARRICHEGALSTLERLHQAFYQEGRDVTDEATLVSVCAEHLGLSEGRFGDELRSEETALETDADFALARDLGVKRFPTLLACRDCTFEVMSAGYAAKDVVEAKVAACFAEAVRA